VRTSSDDLDRGRKAEKGLSPNGEPPVHFERSPGKVIVELKDFDSLFEWDAPPAYPHAGPMLNRPIAKFMIDTVREDRRSHKVDVTIAFRAPPLRPEVEAGARAQMSNFFANEVEMVALEQRVNSTEGWSSLRYAIPVVVIAGLVAGLLTNPSTLDAPAYLAEIAYLVAIVVTWVMLWDPIEKLLFDSYFFRLRIRALNKLAKAEISFVSRPTPFAPAGSTPD
jgi:hypothetical protein